MGNSLLKPVASEQEENMQTVELPLWVEYAKALGAPGVALIAAWIAGRIQNRQAATAKNKLKLDLFELRFAMYERVRDAITILSGDAPLSVNAVKPIVDKLKGVEFLFDDKVAEFVYAIVGNIDDALKLQKLRNEESSRLRKDEFSEEYRRLNEALRIKRDWFSHQREPLKACMRPFLQLTH